MNITDRIKRSLSTLYTHYHFFGVRAALSLILVEIFGESFLSLRHRNIVRFLRVSFEPLVLKYKDAEYPTEIIHEYDPIWTFWAQGEEEMPLIAKKCIEQMRLNADGRDVNVLDFNTIFNYVDIPRDIWLKAKTNEIGLAHFSDVVRCALLSQYGGIWIDACILLTRPLPVFNNCYFTIPGYLPNSPSAKRWICGVQGAVKNNPFHSFVYDVLVEYHKKGLPPIDYLLLDYVMLFAYHEIPAVRRMVDHAQKDITDFHFISRNRNNILSRKEFESAFRRNILMRTSYQWNSPISPNTVLGQVLSL